MSFAIDESIASIEYPRSISVLADKAGVTLLQGAHSTAGYSLQTLGLTAAQAAELAYWLMRGAMYADPKAASKWLFELETDRLQEAA